MSNALTSDWDLMQAIKVSAVNEAIAADLKSSSPSFPTGFDHKLVYTQSAGQPSVEIAGTFTGWAVVGGSGQNVQLSTELTFSKAVMTENGQTSDLIVWTPGQYRFSATVELSTLSYENDPGGTQKLKTSKGTQIVFAQIYGTPATSAPSVTAGTAPAQPYTISDIDFLGGSQINSAFTDWCQTNLAPSVVYCFLAITAEMLSGKTFSWATPTLASYSVNMPGGAGDGVFAQYSMTENRQPDTPYPVVQGDIIPSGSDALLGVATDRFLTKILQQCLAQNFVGCTAADFAPVYTDTDASMATGLVSTATLTFPTFTLDNGDTVTATIPSGGVQLDIAGDSLQIQMNGIIFECPKLLGIIASGIYVTLNYSCTANLAMSGQTIALNNIAHTLNYSVSYSSAYTWISVGVGVLSVVLVMSGLFSEVGVAADAAEAEAATAVVSEAEAAGSIDMTAMTGDFSSISADISSGADMSAADASQMTTVSTEIDAAATNTPVNASGYIVRTLVRTILTAMAGYGAYATVKFQVIGNTVRLLDGGDVTDPITLADFSGDLLSPVSWTNVGNGWSPTSAALNDGLGIGMRFA